jgi:hypothetical protein
MKNLMYITMLLAFAVFTASCGAVDKVQKDETEIAGYTLKNKKELMQQKILAKQSKTIIAIP